MALVRSIGVGLAFVALCATLWNLPSRSMGIDFVEPDEYGEDEKGLPSGRCLVFGQKCIGCWFEIYLVTVGPFAETCKPTTKIKTCTTVATRTDPCNATIKTGPNCAGANVGFASGTCTYPVGMGQDCLL
jgi:hypothetical protein